MNWILCSPFPTESFQLLLRKQHAFSFISSRVVQNTELNIGDVGEESLLLLGFLKEERS